MTPASAPRPAGFAAAVETGAGEPDAGASAAAASTFGAELLAGLRARPRCVAPKWFYDEAGSALFDRITELPEYYPTRTEIGLLDRHAAAIGAAAAALGPAIELVEFGAGSARKVRLLLDALPQVRRYLPIDISGPHLERAAAALRAERPALVVQPVVADYTAAPALPAAGAPRLGFFPGSTIGNLEPLQAQHLLHQMRRWLEGATDGAPPRSATGALLIGFDLVKDPALLHAAYNDAAGVTAAFNLNLLARANRELGADFDLAQFAHCAFYNPPRSRIEMHLVSRRRQVVHVAGTAIPFDEGDSVHTESSYKYTAEGFADLAAGAGWAVQACWTDPARRFALGWLRPA